MAAVADVTPVCTTWFTSPVTLTTHAFLHIPMHLRPGVSVQPGGVFPRNAFMTSAASPFLAHAFPTHLHRGVDVAGGSETCAVAWVSSSHGGHAVVGGGARTPAALAGGRHWREEVAPPSSSSDSSMKVIEQYGDGTQSGSSAGSHSSSHRPA